MVVRIAVVLASLAALFGTLWLALPVVRGWMLPEAGAATGILWVVGPATALRFGACTVLSAITLPFVLRPLGRRWREEDLRSKGGPVNPMAAPSPTRTAYLIRGGLLFIVYAVCGLFYFLSHTEVRAASFDIHSPIGTRSHAYEHVRQLQHQPPVGGQVDRYAIEFDDGSWGYFDADCEGVSEADVLAIADHVSRRAGRAWVPGTR